MRALLALLVVLLLPVAGAHAQREPSGVKGLFLLTDFPSQTIRAGEVTTIRVKVDNAGLLPQPLALSLNGVPAGWRIDLLGGGQPVGAVMVGVNHEVTLQLRVEVPKNAPPGSQTVVLTARSQFGQQASLPLTLTVGTEVYTERLPQAYVGGTFPPLGGTGAHLLLALSAAGLSVTAVVRGWLEHREARVFSWALPAWALLAAARLGGESLGGEVAEILITVAAGGLLTVTHQLNRSLAYWHRRP